MTDTTAPPQFLETSEFSVIRRNGLPYVDKTEQVWDLFKKGYCSHVLCPHPPQFGKTLTVSTLEALFNGEYDLFKGLAIESHLDDERLKKSPVLRFDMQRLDIVNGDDALEASLMDLVREQYEKFNVPFVVKKYPQYLEDLCEKLCEDMGEVVVLFDNYDYPLIMTKHYEDLNADYRATMSSFYNELYCANENIHFAFYTGISPCDEFYVFNDDLYLDDLSRWSDFRAIFGFSEDEIHTHLGDKIKYVTESQNMTEKEIFSYLKLFCIGFGDEKHAYNPYETLRFLFDDMPKRLLQSKPMRPKSYRTFHGWFPYLED
jgi:hypothetical protein